MPPALQKETYVYDIMLKRPATPMKRPVAGARVLSPRVLMDFSAAIANAVNVGRVERRNGGGHLDPIHEADLRARVRERALRTPERAFVSSAWSADTSAEESGEEFVMTVTSGEDGGESALDEETSEERGGPFIETSAREEFAYDTDESNPTGATREPFPVS
jgi:hypothetical protein